MTIFYSVISRGTTVLAKYAACTGNFQEVTEQILKQIPLEDSKLTYSHDNYLFHYMSEKGIIYMCITDDEFERSRAFLFLNDIKKRFQSMIGDRAMTALPYSMDSEFSRILANEMKHYSSSRDIDTISKVHGELDELKKIMVKNIEPQKSSSNKNMIRVASDISELLDLPTTFVCLNDCLIAEFASLHGKNKLTVDNYNVATRGERLELLINKTENLTSNSVSFRQSSRNLARALFWKNVKFYLLIAFISLVVLYLLISLACGGFAWKSCVG